MKSKGSTMPSDQPEIYLRKILVSGTKPFRYRSGIRTLLGLPENPDPRIAYPLALPLPGFNYLRQTSFDEVELETSRMFSETGFAESENAELPKKPQFQITKESPAKTETGETTAIRGIRQSPPRSDTPKQSVRRPRKMSEPTRTDRRTAQDRGEHTATEELRIDIPGISETQLCFPALEPRKIEENPVSETPRLVSPVQEKKEQQQRSAAIEPTKHPAPRLPSREPAVVRDDDPMSPHPILEFKAAKPHASVGEEIAEKASPYRKTLSLTSPQQAAKGQAVPIQPRQQRAAEAQIELLRQKLSVLKRKTASNVPEGRNTPQAERTETNRSASPVAQPVVIVNRSHPQRQSPPAFWERSYLSHFLRLRRLR
jgi:hypothetical protein